MAAGAPAVLAADIDTFVFPGDQEPVLAGIGVAFASATLTAVLGGSGSGKSTSGRLLAGWLLPGDGGRLSGFLELDGTRLAFNGTAADPRVDPGSWGRRVGFVPQDAAAGLSTVRAIISCPSVLAMDEPFASLDAEGAAELAALVRDLMAAGTAVVILSQRADAFLHDADAWLLLAHGTVAAAGTPAELSAAGVLESAGVVRPRSVLVAVPRFRTGQDMPVRDRHCHNTPALELRDVSFSSGLA